MKNWKVFCAIVMVFAVLCGCERGQDLERAREAFIGDYNFVSTGTIDIYMDAVQRGSIPLGKKGEFSLVKGEAANEVLMIAEQDTAVAFVSGHELTMDPVTQLDTMAGIAMEITYNYGTAVLKGKVLNWSIDVSIKGNYQGIVLSGSGPMKIIATKKD